MHTIRANLRTGWRRLAVLFALGAGLCLGASAGGATLDVELDVRTRTDVARGGEARREKEVVILVLDRSGSMTNPAGGEWRNGETRDAALKEMLLNRLDMLAETRPDAEVWTITFASAISSPQGPYSPKDAKRILGGLKPPEGATLLYDAMARAVEFGEERMEKDSNSRISLYFYSDGDNYFPRDYWEDPEASWWHNKVDVRYNGADAAEKFQRDFQDRIQAYADAGKMSLETGCWLGVGEPPVMIENKRKDEYPLELTADGTSLKNPAATPSQGLKARLLVPLPERFAKDLDGLEASLVFEAGKKRSVERFSLKPGKRTVRLNLPDGLPAAAFKGQLSVLALPDVWKGVALAEPEPVELSFAEPGALSLSVVAPRGESWVATGTPVEFSATATEGAEVAWSIDGKEVGKGTFAREFDRAGNYKVEASARKPGFRPATNAFALHAVDTAVTVAMESPSEARVGVPVSFEAKSAGGEKVSWWVDGQAAEGKGARLEDWMFDESGHHTAKARVYFGHGLSGEGEAHFEVSVAPRVVIAAPLDGEEFGFGEEFKAMAKVEGGFERVTWTLSGPSEATREAAVDRDERRTMEVSFKPGKGGDYELTAVAEGPAGRMESQPVRFSIAREDAWVRIDEPASGASVSTGDNLAMKAHASGEEANSILWTVSDASGQVLFSKSSPTEGGVSQCAFPVPETLGNGTQLFVVAEAAGNPALRSERDVETRCANCAALQIGATIVLSHDDKKGLTFGRGEKILAVINDLQGNAGEFEWTFGGTRKTGRVAEWDGWPDYGVYPVQLTGRCGKCGALHTFGQVQVTIAPKAVTASFEIEEAGSYYVAGGKIHLKSTCGGENDITDYVWTVDGGELAEFRGKKEAMVELPFKPCDMVLALTVTGPDGSTHSPPPMDIRVRYGWWATVPAVLILGLLLFVAFRLLLGNTPRKWSFYTWEGGAPKMVNGSYPDELGDAYLTKGVPSEGTHSWNFWTKKGTVRLGNLLLLEQAGEGNPWIPFSETEFEVQCENGTPIVTPPAGKFEDVTGEVKLAGQDAAYFLFRYCGSDYIDEISDGHDHVRIRVVDNGGGAFGVVAFLLTFGLLLWAFVDFCLRYAI